MKNILIILLTIVPFFSSGQTEKDYRVILSSETFLSKKNLEHWEDLQQEPSVIFNNEAYLLIQFNDIPSEYEKSRIKESGIELLRYLPHYCWIVRIPELITKEDLKEMNVRFISEVKSSWKMPLNMQAGEIPPHAGDINKVHVRVLFWENIRFSAVEKLFINTGAEAESINKKYADINISPERLRQLAENPWVQYIEWPEKHLENEFREEISLIQSNYISDNPGRGLFFDGSGVEIAVNEGGIVDSLHQPNFLGRLNRNLESGNVSGHKTGVGRRMASAGNLNPAYRGTAFGAILHSGGINFSNAADSGISIVNNSFGWGCIGASTSSTYNSGAENNDNLVRMNPSFMVTYSCGNMGGSDCGYGNGAAGAGWGNITGLTKSGKNIFAVGSLNTSGNLTGFSSRGPAWDGRILPGICATGSGGTSHASPNLAGVFAQLTQAYKFHNGGNTPNSGLTKAILMNSAEDIENEGPDFKSGYGKINGRKAYEIIAGNQFTGDLISQGSSKSHIINVPANVKEVKVMLYWTDYEATAGIAGRALVNDLDMTLEDPATNLWQPWVLNPTPDSATLELPAVRSTDSLNNVEQVSLKNPVQGTYTLHVEGTMVPQGPQEYFVVYEFIYDELYMTYPCGGEHFSPGSTERLRWDSQGDTGSFVLYWSVDNGNNWLLVDGNISPSQRYYDWTVPDTFTKDALIKVERTSATAVCDSTFNILQAVNNLSLIWSCSDSSLLYWDSVEQVDGYIIYKLGSDYMDSLGYSTTNRYLINNLSLTESDYLAIAAVRNGALSRRSVAIERSPFNFNCIAEDIGITSLVSPEIKVLPSCAAGDNMRIEINIRNWGINSLSNIPLAYSIDGTTSVKDTAWINLPTGSETKVSFNSLAVVNSGSHSLQIWTDYPTDGNRLNDTLTDSLIIYTSVQSGLPLTETFDSFVSCPTAWGCETINCTLTGGWYNLTNNIGDEIDWRTDDSGTGTGATGPSSDHTTGSGNYLYLEGSGNSGSGCQLKESILHSPCLDLTNATQAELFYWYHAYGSSIGSLHTDIIREGILYKDIIPPVEGEQGNQWDSLWVDLSPFAGSEVVLVFRGYTGGGYHADLAIDDVQISGSIYAGFSSPQHILCDEVNISLMNNSVFADSFIWTISPGTYSFANGSTMNSENPEIIFSDSGFYSIQLNAFGISGTDSMLQTNTIYVHSGLNRAVTQNGLTLIADDTTMTYQWIDCDNNNSAIQNAINHHFSPVINGNYAVIISDNVCSDTSDCYNVTGVGIEKLNNEQKFRVYPNPTSGMLTIDLSGIYKEIIISTKNILGQKIGEQKFIDQSIINLEIQQSPAVYFISIRTDSGEQESFKIIKE